MLTDTPSSRAGSLLQFFVLAVLFGGV